MPCAHVIGSLEFLAHELSELWSQVHQFSVSRTTKKTDSNIIPESQVAEMMTASGDELESLRLSDEVGSCLEFPG